MPADYKLIYFDGRGRAELIRLIFVAANQTFEDSRIDVTKWPELKVCKYAVLLLSYGMIFSHGMIFPVALMYSDSMGRTADPGGQSATGGTKRRHNSIFGQTIP